MSTKTLSTLRLGLVITAAVILTQTPAAADNERQACVSAAEHAQTLRDSGKYRQAREQLLVCVRDVCPPVVKRDCVGWLNQLESLVPTVVLSAKDGTHDLVDVKVSIDGVVVTEKLVGTPIPTDAGPHTIKFEWSDQTREEQVVISAGQKGRNIVATFGKPAEPAPAAPAAAPAPAPPPTPAPQTRRGSLVPPLVVGAVGLAGLASFAFFGLSGNGDESDLAKRCKPNCEQAKVDDVQTKFVIADISLGVGLVALGVSAYMFIRRPNVTVEDKSVKAARLPVSVDVVSTSHGTMGYVGARF